MLLEVMLAMFFSLFEGWKEGGGRFGEVYCPRRLEGAWRACV